MHRSPEVDPEIEAERLVALEQYMILDSPREPGFDDVVRLAAAICGTPVAAISLLDEARQWLKAIVGLDITETGRAAISLCQWTIAQNEVFVVGDALTDERFAGTPFVTGAPHIRFYAGAPLVTPSGHAIGALCVIDTIPRALTPAQHDALVVLGRHVVGMLELTHANLELRASAAALETERRKAMAALEAKQSFLANMSHELRTPMNGVCTATELLLGTSLDPLQRDDVLTIQSSARGLVAILNDILDLARMESGRVVLDPQPTDLRKLVKDVVSMLRPNALVKKVFLEAFFDPDIPKLIKVDPLRLRQVLVNLVGNALKFTERGGVTVHVRPNGRADSLVISVIDTGIGIPADKRAQIFERFVQAESSTTRRFGGTGLGLAIVRELLDAMDAMVRVAETPNGGSTFVVELSFEPCDAAAVSCTSGEFAAALPATPGGLRVLLAEDDLVNRKLVTRLLERAGCSVRAAENGVIAAAAAIDEEFDLVLMDIEMPELDGYGATAAIRLHEERSGGRKSTILALTAHVLPETRAACVGAGMNGYLSKPLALADLLAALREWCPRPLAA